MGFANKIAPGVFEGILRAEHEFSLKKIQNGGSGMAVEVNKI